MKKCLTELTGTFILIFVGIGAIIVDQQTNALGLGGIASVWGLCIVALIYALGDISGAHLNPVVTVSFALDKRFAWSEVFPYVGAQLLGALIASALLQFLFPSNQLLGITQPLPNAAMQSFILEIVMMFILMTIILRVSTGSKEKGITAGIAIGVTVLLLVLMGGPISGTSLNPVRSFAPALVSGHLESIWIYLLAPFIGGLLAVSLNRVISDDSGNLIQTIPS